MKIKLVISLYLFVGALLIKAKPLIITDTFTGDPALMVYSDTACESYMNQKNRCSDINVLNNQVRE